MIENGRPNPDDWEVILDRLVKNSEDYWGEDISESASSALRALYEPNAKMFEEMQQAIGLVLDSAQIDHAEGDALDFLTALIGVKRESAQRATGEVEFSRDSPASTDYTVPSGTVVQTDSATPVRFETTESRMLQAGDTTITAPVRATEPGVHGNVGANTLVLLTNGVPGIDSVTNPEDTLGGKEQENDDELRDRAKDELGAGAKATAKSLINAAKTVDGVTSVSIFLNNGTLEQIDNGGEDGFELVVNGGHDEDIAQAIRDTMAAGDTSWGGYNGTVTEVAEVDLGNGQTVPVEFSRPNEVQVYMDMTLEVTENYDGDAAVRDALVDYIGGIFSSGQEEPNGLGVGDDVIYTEAMARVQMVPGVHDVTSLTLGASASPTGESNLVVAESEVASADATDDSLTITRTDV